MASSDAEFSDTVNVDWVALRDDSSFEPVSPESRFAVAAQFVWGHDGEPSRLLTLYDWQSTPQDFPRFGTDVFAVAIAWPQQN